MPRLLWGFSFADDAKRFVAEMRTAKLRKQIVKKARALQLDPYPLKSKQLDGIMTDLGEHVRSERSGDYRILYVVRDNPAEVVILDIDHRKDVYR